MAKTVDEGFREFHGMLTPTQGESQAVKSHRASIEGCLIKHFEMKFASFAPVLSEMGQASETIAM